MSGDRGYQGQFDPADFEARYVEFARLLGFVSKNSVIDAQGLPGGDANVWSVMLDDEWYGGYGSEFRSAMEYIRYMGFEEPMREALDAIGAGACEVPAYRNV